MFKKNIVKIPKQFELYGFTIKVVGSNTLISDMGYTGLSDHRKRLITLQKSILLA